MPELIEQWRKKWQHPVITALKKAGRGSAYEAYRAKLDERFGKGELRCPESAWIGDAAQWDEYV